MKKKKKQISKREHDRRKFQPQSEWLYTPEGLLSATKVKHGYKLSKPNDKAHFSEVSDSERRIK